MSSGGRRPQGRLGPWVVALALAGLAAGSPAAGAAQVADSLEQEVDSARIRVLERLRSLSKPPGVDSTLFRLSPPTTSPQVLTPFLHETQRC